jgi:hypothetical protein
MSQNDPLDHGQILHEGFTDAIQELLGAHAPTNFKLERVNGTTIKVAAGTENSQVSIAVKGRYRWRTTETTAVLPGGLPDGEHPVFVTASDNDYTGPIEDPDAPTVYTFGLEIKESGKTPATALWREVGKVTVTAGAITAIRQTVASVSGAQIENGALSSESPSDIEWTRAPGGGLVAKLRAALAAELGVDGSKADSSLVTKEESRSGEPFASMATEDKAVITLATAGLMRIGVMAEIKSSKSSAGLIAVEINGVIAGVTAGESIKIEGKSIEEKWTKIFTSPEHLISVEADEDHVLTLEQMGISGTAPAGTPWVYRAPAGTYIVKLKYKTNSGTVSARNRCLYVEGQEFH